jgi:hypothetical protein
VLDLPAYRAQREVALAMLIGAFGTALIVLGGFSGRIRHHQPIATLSIVLPVLMLAAMLAAAWAVRSERVSISANAELTIERKRLGRLLDTRRLAWSDVSGAWSVQSEFGTTYVLVATRRGPVALPCADQQVPELLALLDRARA